jgi:hypothetical protein
MSYVKITRENAQKFIEYKQDEANFRRTITNKPREEQRKLIEQFSSKWWSSH